MRLMTIPEVAERIGVAESRARFLVSSGRIRGQQVGGRWVIDEADAAEYRGAGPGRPLSQRSAWQFIEALQDPACGVAPHLSAVERHRLRRRIARFQESSDPVALVLSLLPRRADKAVLSASPSDLDGLREDRRLRLSGVSHPDCGLLPSSEFEAYAARHDLPGVVSDWFLVPAGLGVRANVVIRTAEVIPDSAIPVIVVAADLAERPGSREQQAALGILRGFQRR
jgi:excisionase family DNA binding protein